jgi:hypothetical protein
MSVSLTPADFRTNLLRIQSQEAHCAEGAGQRFAGQGDRLGAITLQRVQAVPKRKSADFPVQGRLPRLQVLDLFQQLETRREERLTIGQPSGQVGGHVTVGVVALRCREKSRASAILEYGAAADMCALPDQLGAVCTEEIDCRSSAHIAALRRGGCAGPELQVSRHNVPLITRDRSGAEVR